MIYLTAFLVPLLIALIFTPLLMILSRVKKVGVDTVDDRKIHVGSISRLGGVAIFLGCFTYLMIAFLALPELSAFWGIFMGMLALLVVVIPDDLLGGISPWVKLLGQILAGLVAVIFSGVLVDYIVIPGFDMPITFDGPWGKVFTVFCIVGIINAFNMIDGLDGLAGGLTIIAIGFFIFLAVLKGDTGGVLLLSIALSGAVFAFLVYNSHPARIFMGDTGSMMIGFLLAVIAIKLVYDPSNSGYSVQPMTAVLILGVPLVDILWSMLRRLYLHSHLFAPDRDHLHHKLMDAGLNHRGAVIILYLLGICMGYTALLLNPLGNTILFVAFFLFILLILKMLTLFSRFKIPVQLNKYLSS